MSERTTACEVKAIRPTTFDVKSMIVAASTIVDTLNARCGKSFSDETLASIELWLAAHFVGTIDPTKSKEKFENYEQTFQLGSNSLSGVMSDKYGQTANMLSEGCLAQFDLKPATVNFL